MRYMLCNQESAQYKTRLKLLLSRIVSFIRLSIQFILAFFFRLLYFYTLKAVRGGRFVSSLLFSTLFLISARPIRGKNI